MSQKEAESDRETAERIGAMVGLSDSLAAAQRLIEENQSFIIAAHERADPDSLGSALALARVIRQIGKRAVVISADGVPEICSYLPDAESVVADTAERGFDVAVICDAAGVDRAGAAADVLASARHLLVIDHHPLQPPTEPPAGFEDVVYLVEASLGSTAELCQHFLTRLLAAHEGKSLDPEMARQLMAGLVGDTGAFRFPNTSAATFIVASWLTMRGASAAEAATQIYENRPLVNVRLLGSALLCAEVEADGKIVWSQITRDDFARFGATDNDTDSIVNQLLATRGARVAVLFREVEPERVRVSLRSREGIDVNQIARAFGGGGHTLASGCTIETSLPEAERAVLTEVRKWMES